MKLSILPAEPKEAFEAGEAVEKLELCNVRLERIVVAVDFSEDSRKALEYAAALAKKLEAEIVLVHVFEGVPGELKILEAAFVDTSFREEARENLAEWQRDLAAMGVVARPVFREAKAIGREILNVAKETKAELIVIGRHGSEGFFPKNIVKKVLGHAPCAVMVGP